MDNNEIIYHNPCKGKEVIKRDRAGEMVRDPITSKPVRIAKMLMICNPRILHQHMIQTFDQATEQNKVLISKSSYVSSSRHLAATSRR